LQHGLEFATDDIGFGFQRSDPRKVLRSKRIAGLGTQSWSEKSGKVLNGSP
jgi:hypothetical protein